ncbi:MAG: hypothetical protein AAFV69_06690, partial [Pseudomonadota bacterium]
ASPRPNRSVLTTGPSRYGKALSSRQTLIVGIVWRMLDGLRVSYLRADAQFGRGDARHWVPRRRGPVGWADVLAAGLPTV